MLLLLLLCCEPSEDSAAPVPVSERCDGEDNNGDGRIDENFPDEDQDGLVACIDCNDGDPSITVGSPEVEDGRDNDCDQRVDNGLHPDLYRFVKRLNFQIGSDMVALPDGRLLVSDMTRTLNLVDPSVPEVVATLPYPAGYNIMLSLALDPQFGDGLHDYLYAYGGGSAGIRRYPLSLSPFSLGEPQDVFDPGCSGEVLMCHGDLLWWSTEAGHPVLYVSTNQGPGTDQQDSGNLGSKLLALEVDPVTGAGTPAFQIGYDNDYVVALGLRNPWRLADCGTGICIADPGENIWDEVDFYTVAGRNYGWPFVEGPEPGYEEPVFSWGHDESTWAEDDPLGPGKAGFAHAPFVGLRVSKDAYNGKLAGKLLFSDLYDGWVRGLDISQSGGIGASVTVSHQMLLMAMVEAGGRIYAIDIAGGFYELEPWDERPVVTSSWLSETHYQDATPYFVEHPLYSNGADKDRRIWLPAGSTIKTTGPSWVYPEGTELFKTFAVGQSAVETRMLVKTATGWLATTFLWAGDDAYRYDGTRRTVQAADGSPYIVPSENSCFDCHDATRGRELPLLDPYVLGDKGLADLTPFLDRDPGPAPRVEGTEVEQLVRGYLHINCGFCHNADGLTGRSGPLQFDLRYNADLNIVGQMSSYWADDQGRSALIVDPAHPDKSALVQVMERGQMPYVGVWKPDTERIDYIKQWIRTLQ